MKSNWTMKHKTKENRSIKNENEKRVHKEMEWNVNKVTEREGQKNVRKLMHAV